MSDIQIRRLERADLPEMLRLHLTRDDIQQPEGAHERTELLEWLAFHNPHANGEATYYVAADAGKIVAYHGRMPAYLNYFGQRVKGYFVHDLYVDPEYRKRGKGLWLTLALAKKIEEESDSFFCLYGMTKLNLEMHRRRKYRETFADRYIKLLNPRTELPKIVRSKILAQLFLPVVRLVLWAVDALLLLHRPGDVKVTQIERFDQRFDALNEAVSQKLGVSSHKDSAMLNWRYVDRPYRRDTVYAAERKGELTGFIVLTNSPYRTDFPQGMIVDIVADPEDRKTIAALCRRAVAHFRRQKTDSILAIFSDRRFAAVFQRYLFVKNSGKKMMLGNIERAPILERDLLDLKKWHMTRGESDGFMLLS